MGLSPRPDPINFAKEIFSRDLSNFEMNLDQTSPLFFDRSFLDSACMIFDSNASGYALIKPILVEKRYNSKVFITPPWQEIYKTDSERDQTYEEAKRIYDRVYKWYNQHGYDLIELPKDSLEKRVEFVTNEISI